VKSGFYKNLAVIALPIILQNLMQSFVNMLDTIMVGQLGSIEIAGVGLGNQIFFILNMILFGIGSGGSIFIAQFWGKKDIGGIRRTLGITLSMTLVISVLFTIIAFFFPKNLLGLYSTDIAVIEKGATYLRIVSLSYVVTALSFSFSLALRSTENVKLPLYATIVSLVLNAILNYIFIFVLNMGVAGAAVATIISRIAEFCILFVVAYRRKLPVAAKISQMLSFSKDEMARFLRIAFPVILNETFWGLGSSLHSLILARSGTEAIAAFNITSTVSQLTWVFFIGVGNAAGIIIGKKIGERDDKTALTYANRFAGLMPIMALCIGWLLIPLSKCLPFFFNVEASIIAQASFMLYVLLVTYPFKSFNMCIIVGVCRAGGDTVFAALSDVLFMWGWGIPLGALAAFVFHWEPWAVYACLLSEEIVKSVANFIRLKSKKWLRRVTE
jgi:putative MATE family efflux protein